ncbi:MAG: TIGR01212 family radical SAM protein, partial [Bacteroidales bacterium]|nr:TIGR01212 family radical SAM protein [Bacteroidales bacterium]
MVFPWGHERRYNAYSNYFKKHFGGRVQKLSIDAGFTCPNRDGSKSVGGCTFCNNDAFNPSYCQPSKSITQQLDEGIEFHEWRYKKSCEYLAYFQAYSNTYGPLDKMQRLYSEALSHPKVIGLVIGTRPDCIDEQKLDYLQQLSKDYYITVEYGIESCYDKTLKTINRGHDFQTTVEAIKATAER